MWEGTLPEILARTEAHDWVIKYLSDEKRGLLLDAPAGTGALAIRMKNLGYEVVCYDIDPSIFSADGIEIRNCDLSQPIPYPSTSFDFVTCIEGLEHLENPYNAMREFSRVLKPGGKLILSLPNYLNIERRMKFVITGLFSKVPSSVVTGDAPKSNLWMCYLPPLTYPILRLVLEHEGFEVAIVAKDNEKRRMKWLLPIVWAIRLYCCFWSFEKRKLYHLDETLSSPLLMGGNTLIVVAKKRSMSELYINNRGPTFQ